nr:MAG TPA: Heterocyst differentiation regulator C-terminal Hood domain [Caudoviricetes sp.]
MSTPGRLCLIRIFRFEGVGKLYTYGFGKNGERGQGYFKSIAEALDDARKNADEDKMVNIGREDVFEFRVDGQAVLDQIDDDIDAEGIEVDFFWSLNIPKDGIEDLSAMLTKTFREWADKHGYARHIKYCTDCKEYDLTTGEPV